VIFAHIARLRRALAGAEPHGVRLLSTPPGYTLDVDPDRVDAHVFRRRVTEAAAQADPAARAELLRAALGLWRGPALGDLAAGPGPRRLVQALEDLRLTATEDRIDADLSAGRHAGLLGELAELVARHPLRERLAGQLMLAHYRSRSIGAALDVYRRTRADLAAELGLDPGPELDRLHDAILRRDPGLAEPAPEAPAAVPAQLPPPTCGFTGRTEELRRLDGLLDGGPVPIGVICGTAGVGKTALAVQWAHRVADRYPDGQLYLNLRGFEPAAAPVAPDEAVRALLGALGVPPQQLPPGADAQAALYRSLLAGRRVLVVLDNAGTADQVRPLLPGSPGCLALVTSRTQPTSLVAVEGAVPVVLDVFTTGNARELLVRRLGRERVDADPGAVDDIIAGCARLPLALAVVAARAALQPGFPLSALAAQLHRDGAGPNGARLDALDGGDPATRVRAVFSWSYERLTAPAARLFRLLGLHCGPDVAAPAAASLAGVPVGAALAELTGAHLLTERSPGRYGCHDLLRAYAAELAAAQDPPEERDAAVRRMLDHYLHTAYAAALLLNPHRQPIAPAAPQPGVTPEQPADAAAALAWFAAEHQVLLAATSRAGAYTWQLAWCLTTFFERRGHWPDLAAVQRTALSTAQRLGDRAGQAHAHYGLARACARMGREDEAQSHFRYAVELFAALGDHTRQARTRLGLAWVADLAGRADEALDHAQQALALTRRAGNRALRANALNAVGWYHARLGDGRQALKRCRQALALQQELGDRNGEATTWHSVGYAYHLLGRYEEAAACYTEALRMFRELGDRYNEADTLNHLGETRYAAGEPDAAGIAWRGARDIFDQLRHPQAERLRDRLQRVPAPAVLRLTAVAGGGALFAVPGDHGQAAGPPT
jgi:DNA-binding SARP family transcriptional activator/tetratricopeptide (TPR) repeat protein